MTVRIRDAAGPADLEAVRGLLEADAASIGVDLGFQGFDDELADLPGDYAPPRASTRPRAFREIAPYRENPVPGTRYLELRLR